MKYINLVICLLFFLSCNGNREKKQVFDRIILKSIISEDMEIPSQYSFYFFVKCDTQQIAMLDIDELKAICRSNHKQTSFAKFLKPLLDQDKYLGKVDGVDCFNLEQKVTDDYRDNSLDDFILMYCDNEIGRYTIKNNLSDQVLKSVSYYLFLNNYYVHFDDYIGIYYVSKSNFFYK